MDIFLHNDIKLPTLNYLIDAIFIEPLVGIRCDRICMK